MISRKGVAKNLIVNLTRVFLLRSQTGLKMESRPENSQKHFTEEVRTLDAEHLNINNRPTSVRSR